MRSPPKSKSAAAEVTGTVTDEARRDGKVRTFIDASVLIRATNIDDAALIDKIILLMKDARRELVSNDWLELEVLPKPVHNKQRVSVESCQDFFGRCVRRVETDGALVRMAYVEACLLGLSAADAMHLVTAHVAGAQELITAEKRTKPMYRSKLVKVVRLLDA